MSLTAEKILATTSPSVLFGTTDPDKEYKKLLKKWHPDLSDHPRAAEVTVHLNLIHSRKPGERVYVTDSEGHTTIEISGKDGRTRRLRYRVVRQFELGEIYVGDTAVAWKVSPEHSSLWLRGATTISTLPFADDRMMTEVGQFLPEPKATVSFVDVDGFGWLVQKKLKTEYLASDVLRAAGGAVDPVHAAWMTSGILNICCYMQWAQSSHGDVSPSSILIDPSRHSVSLVGGWWYATPFDQKLTHLPRRTVNIAPQVVNRPSDPRTDLVLAKAFVREMLGDPTGMNDLNGSPRPMADFLRGATSGSAIDDYRVWRNETLEASFGPKRFVRMAIDEEAVYG